MKRSAGVRVRKMALVAMPVVIAGALLVGVGPSASADASTIVAPDATASSVAMIATRFDPTTGATLYTVTETITTPDANSPSQVTTVIANASGDVTSTTTSVLAAGVSIEGSVTDPAASMSTMTGDSPDAPDGGCCSTSGGWNLTISVTNGPSWWPNFTYNSYIQWCWAHNEDFNCNNGFGSNAIMPTNTWFTNLPDIGTGNLNNTIAQNEYFYDYGNFGYHSGFEDYKEGQVAISCLATCWVTHHPSINIWAHANGEYDYNLNAG